MENGINIWRCFAITDKGKRCRLKVTDSQKYYQEGKYKGIKKPLCI